MNHIRPHIARFVAIAVIAVFYSVSRLPALTGPERAALAARFGFTGTVLPDPAGVVYQDRRPIHPDLEQVAGWLSAFGGAAVALNDLDGDGLANDLCRVDIRIDQVIVAPAPGTPERYEPFILDHTAVPYDETAMAPAGCLPHDMNEDGRLDLLVYYWGRTPLAFLNTGPATLSAAAYTPIDILPDDSLWWSSSATFADFDLLVANYFPDDALLLGSGPGRLIHMSRSLSRAFNGGGTHLFLWEEAAAGSQPQVEFRKVETGLAPEVAQAWTLAVGAADLDGRSAA